MYNDDLISQGRLKLAQALLKVEGYKMSLGTPENVGQRTADVPYTIEYVGGSDPKDTRLIHGYPGQAMIRLMLKVKQVESR